MSNLKIEIGGYKEYGTSVCRLLRRVFVDEQDVPEDEVFDGLHEGSVFIAAFEDAIPIAAARLRKDGDDWRLGWIAVEKKYRMKHIGEKVVQAAISYVASNEGGEIMLTSQQQAQGFYEKLGFAPCGEPEPLKSGFVLVPMKLSVSKTG